MRHRIAAGRLGVSIAVLLASGSAAFGSPPASCSLGSTVADAKITISTAGSRTSFHDGEIIPLVLSFTSPALRRYWVDNRSYDRTGRLNFEAYCLQPAAPDPLADYFAVGAFITGGLGSERQLSTKPFIATADLNEWRRLGPGHYRLFVVSSRVWRPPEPGEATPYDRVPVTLRSNTIEFDVTESDSKWSTEQLQQATIEYENGNDAQRREAARRLRFLNTKESAATLAKLFYELNSEPGGWDLMFGLVGSPYRAEAIAAMQQEIDDPQHPIAQDFLRTLTNLQIYADPALTPPAYDPAHPSRFQQYSMQRQEHERALMQAELRATTLALSTKTGTAYALTVLALDEAPSLATRTESDLRTKLIAAWPNLPEDAKLDLLQYRWPLIAAPEALPLLNSFISRPVPPWRTREADARDAAIKHLYDLDPTEGRAAILRDLRNPDASPSLSLVKLVPADELHPIVQEAIGRIEKSDARYLDYYLLALFGDGSTANAIERLFNQHLGGWACAPQTQMLQYFLRVDPKFGSDAVQTSLAARSETGCYRFLLQDLGPSLPKVEALAIRELDDPDLEVANDAALALGKWGTASAEPALWARLQRFHEEWQGREDDLRVGPNYESPTSRAAALESTLVGSIASAGAWICGPEKLERLQKLASPRQQMRVSAWIKLWQGPEPSIIPSWYPQDHLTFSLLQYSALDEEQLRAKLSQMPAGTKLGFQIWKPGQIEPPVTIETQLAVFQALHSYAARFGVAIEKKSD